MKCTLMHKRIAVAQIELDDVSGFVQKINCVMAPEHLPVGTGLRNGVVDRRSLNDWWTGRSIPASRSGIREALETLNISSTKILLVRCFGLSLSDQYWIRPENSNITWDSVNFFDNAFSDDMGDVLFGRPQTGADFDFSSPDNTSDGCLKKRWKIIDGKRCLIKGGSNPFRQQPFNEVIASKIMERLHIDHVPYSVIWSEDSPYSVCEDFVTADTELVSAWHMMQAQKKDNNSSVYQHFVKCCQTVGISDIVPALDRMIVLDYIIANEDRHFNNFGLLRNAETLEWIGTAPIYDSGTSLGYDKLANQIRAGRDITCKPFKKHHVEQLKLVSSFDWIDFDSLKDIGEIITETMSEDQAKELIDEARIAAIAEAAERRVQMLQSFAMVHGAPTPTDSPEDDVEEDVAEDYTPKLSM